MARLLADEDIYSDLISRIRADGHDIAPLVDLPNRGSPDHQLMLYAAAERRTIVTHNWRHFLMLHRAWMDWSAAWELDPPPAHSGIPPFHRRTFNLLSSLSMR